MSYYISNTMSIRSDPFAPEKPVMWRTAAYVDINAWKAGIVEKAEDYEWCSFAAAAGGDKKHLECEEQEQIDVVSLI